jgi:hypothetical protein
MFKYYYYYFNFGAISMPKLPTLLVSPQITLKFNYILEKLHFKPYSLDV